MSYWYERVVKKKVIVLVACLLILIVNAISFWSSSYASGCVATASRTLYDWISVDASFNSFEVFPFVYMAIEIGCTEWLGFSTCETVQFRDWVQIWSSTETLSIHIFNISNAGQTNDFKQIKVNEVPSLEIQREYTDDGISVSPGLLQLKRQLRYIYQFDKSRLSEPISTIRADHSSLAPGSLSPNSFTTIKVSDLLGNDVHSYLDTSAEQKRHENLEVPSRTNKMLGTKSLLYFLNTHTEGRRCSFDDDCGASCTWTTTCQPLGYGLEGMLMPSGTFWFNIKSIAILDHWPVRAFNYREFCPQQELDMSCLRGKGREVNVFSADSFSLSSFDNTGESPSEKFPDLAMQLWKETGRIRRTEGCDGLIVLGLKGKDCGIPVEYTFSAQDLYLSSPQDSSGVALQSEIYSEWVSGFRFDFLDVWQMNRRLTSDTFLPLFWIQRKAGAVKISDEHQFSAFKTYGMEIVVNMFVGWFIYAATFWVALYLFLYGIACLAHLDDATSKYTPPNYL